MIDYFTYVLAPQLLHGLIWGVVIALIALGLTIVFGLMGVVNFAHGEFYMLGAFLGYSLLFVLNDFWVAMLVAAAATGILGMLVEKFLLRRLYARDPIFQLLLTFGLGIFMREVVRAIWGGLTRRVEPPVSGAMELMGVMYPTYRLVVLAVGVMCIFLIWWVLHRTRAGVMLRAACQDRHMSVALGVNVDQVYAFTFSVGICVAGMCGVLMSPIYFVYPTMGVDAILRAFIVVIVGGMGSLMGAVVASLLIAEVEALASLWISPSWAETAVFAVLIVVLIVRPTGLLGRR